MKIIVETPKDKNDLYDGKNHCPICNHTTLNYESFELIITGSEGYYPFICPFCGCAGKEWYDIVYRESTKDVDKDRDLVMGVML